MLLLPLPTLFISSIHLFTHFLPPVPVHIDFPHIHLGKCIVGIDPDLDILHFCILPAIRIWALPIPWAVCILADAIPEFHRIYLADWVKMNKSKNGYSLWSPYDAIY